jgi:hypothetical protein
VRQRNICFGRADAVVRVSIDGLNEDAALRALKLANREAVRRLEAATRTKKLRYPITFKMLDSTGLGIADVTEVGLEANAATTPEFLFYPVGEDAQGRIVSARIELVCQVIQLPCGQIVSAAQRIYRAAGPVKRSPPSAMARLHRHHPVSVSLKTTTGSRGM